MFKSIEKMFIVVAVLCFTAIAQVEVSVSPDGPMTIQAAIDSLAPDGGTVILDEGVYTGAGNVKVSTRGLPVTVRGLEPGNPDNDQWQLCHDSQANCFNL